MSKSIFRLTDIITSDQLLALFCVSAFAFTVYYSAAFFVSLNSTISDFSWGDVSWINQAFYNFTHGRLLQTSIYCYSGEGVIHNPYSYSSQLAMHVNWFPYVFSVFYRLMPDINGLYAIVFLWDYLGFGYFTWKILKHLSPQGALVRFCFAASLFMAGSFMPIIRYKALFLLFSGPLIMALFYYLICRRRTAFLMTGALLCLVSEDAAMFAVCFSAYVFLFHRDQRDFACRLFCMAAAYLLLVVLIISPAAKYDLVLATKDASDIVIRFKRLAAGEYPLFWRDLVPMRSFILGGFGMLLIMFPPRGRTEWAKIAGLVFVAPLTHWVIALAQGGGHHLLPVAAAAFSAMLLYLGSAGYENRTVKEAPAMAGAVLIGILLLRFNGGIVRAGLIPPMSYARLASSDGQIISNKAFLKAARAVPSTKSVCYWTNRGVEGFLSNRSDLWRFPRNFDQTDFLMIQKDATAGFYEVKTPLASDLHEMARGGSDFSTGAHTVVNQEAVTWIVNGLVKKAGTHIIAREDEHLLFLERKSASRIVMPEFSLGLGWAANIPKLFSGRAP